MGWSKRVKSSKSPLGWWEEHHDDDDDDDDKEYCIVPQCCMHISSLADCLGCVLCAVWIYSFGKVHVGFDCLWLHDFTALKKVVQCVQSR